MKKYKNLSRLMLNTTSIVVFLFASFAVFQSCSTNPHDVDLSAVEVDFKTMRLDQDLFHPQTDNYKELNESLYKKYGSFYAEYLSNIIGVGRPDSPMLETHLERFVEDANWQETQRQIDAVFGDLAAYNSGFEKAFRYYRYHFPTDTIPDVVYYNSGFNVGVYPTGEYLGVGLEWFLGAESPVIQRLAIESFPKYLKDKLKPDYMVNNAVKGWLMVKNQHRVQKEDLINLMIFHGKVLYLMDALFPEATDEMKINYTPDELVWCKNNEYNIWAHLIESDLLFTDDVKTLAGFLNDGPFTPAFQQNSPSRTGVWVGWQIVRQFMEKNAGYSLKELLNEQNNQRILKHYKP